MGTKIPGWCRSLMFVVTWTVPVQCDVNKFCQVGGNVIDTPQRWLQKLCFVAFEYWSFLHLLANSYQQCSCIMSPLNNSFEFCWYLTDSLINEFVINKILTYIQFVFVWEAYIYFLKSFFDTYCHIADMITLILQVTKLLQVLNFFLVPHFSACRRHWMISTCSPQLVN